MKRLRYIDCDIQYLSNVHGAVTAAYDFAGVGVPVAVAGLPRQERGKRRNEVQANPRDNNDEVDVVQSYNRHRCITNS